MGFDCLLVAFMAATAVLGWLRRQLVLLTVFTMGVLLICDAWFDILTAGLGRNLAVAMLTAALGNLPARDDHDHWRSADPATDSDTALFSRPRDATVAPAVAAVTGPGAAPSCLKCYLASRCHHLVKTFCGWRDQQTSRRHGNSSGVPPQNSCLGRR
jgi:hypothetical protein